MKSIFRYPGGKSKTEIANWILSFMPADTQAYRETMVGGGGIFWRVPVKRRWINDLHPGLMSVYTALRDRPEKFIAQCREVRPARSSDRQTKSGKNGGSTKNARLLSLFNELKDDAKKTDPAFRYFFLNRTNFGGRVDYSRPNRFFMSNEEGWNIVAGDLLEQAAEWMKGVRITVGGYAKLLSDPGKKVWVYLDPPYVVNDSLGGDQLYQHNFTEKDHRVLRERVGRSPHKVCLSYDDHPLIRDLYRGFRIVSKTWKYGGTTLAEKKEGKEIVVLNY